MIKLSVVLQINKMHKKRNEIFLLIVSSNELPAFHTEKKEEKQEEKL